MGSHNRRGRYGYARTELGLEQLEARELMAVDALGTAAVQNLAAVDAATVTPTTSQTPAPATTAASSIPTPVASVLANPRSFDGTGNNVAKPQLGSVGTQLGRTADADYDDGISSPAGADRLSPREISNAVVAQTEEEPNERKLSAYIYIFGQFLDHDIDLTSAQTGAGAEKLPVEVPTNDPVFDINGTGTQTLAFTRSVFDLATGKSTANPRQQINQISTWIDGSQVYGSDAATAASLRTFKGGRLKTSEGNLPPTDAAGNFLAGDTRANENIELTSMQALFVREHNQWAAKIAKDNPRLNDEQIYQRARAIVVAELQSITFNEFLPALLGRNAIDRYTGYDKTVDPSIANEFSTAAFRLHTLINDDVEFFGNDGRALRDEVELREAFFNPALFKETGPDGILKYAASTLAQEVDTHIVDGLRNFLFQPGQSGLDLASLNIQRGRDHGLADYNSVRAAYGLPRVTSFAGITSDVAVQQKLASVYDTVDDVDLWVGLISEDHLPGASVGETQIAIIADQFERLRDGDRYWYQNIFSGRQLSQIDNTTLADVIKRNTTVSNLQDNVFFLRAEVSGQVFADANGNGRQDQRETGVAGVTVQLLNDEGDVVASAVTSAGGRYRFDQFGETGDYQVQVLVPTGKAASTPATRSLLISRGGLSLSNYNFGLRSGRINGPRLFADAASATQAGPTDAVDQVALLDAAFSAMSSNAAPFSSTTNRRLPRR